MGLFFIAVGMSIDFGLVASRPLEIVALVAGLLVIKALRAIGRRLGVAARDRWLLAALLSQGGEFAFVVFGVAGKARLLPGAWDELLTLVVALSMALTPYMHIVERSWSNAAARAGHDPCAPAAPGEVYFAAAGVLPDAVTFHWGGLDHQTKLLVLHAAGAEQAKLLVLAIDDPEASVRHAEVVRQHFPKLHVVARARNISHWVELRKRGVDAVERDGHVALLVGGPADSLAFAWDARARRRFRTPEPARARGSHAALRGRDAPSLVGARGARAARAAVRRGQGRARPGRRDVVVPERASSAQH